MRHISNEDDESHVSRAIKTFANTSDFESFEPHSSLFFNLNDSLNRTFSWSGSQEFLFHLQRDFCSYEVDLGKL